MRRGHDLFIYFIFVLGKCYDIKKDTIIENNLLHDIFYFENRTVTHEELEITEENNLA